MVSAALVVCVGAFSAQEYFARHWGGGPLAFRSMLLAQSLSAALWLTLAPVIIAPLARRFPLDRELLPRNGTIHIASAVGVSLLHLALVSCLFAARYFGWSPQAFWDVFRDRMHTTYVWDVVLYLVIAAALNQRQLREAALETVAPASPTVAEPVAESADATIVPAVAATVTVSQTVDPDPGDRCLRRILVKHDGRISVVPVEDVSWIEASDNDVIVHAKNGNHIVRSTLARLAARLDPERFVRVHRSTIVNVERVREVQPYFNGELVLFLEDSTRLTIGRTYRDGFLAALEG